MKITYRPEIDGLRAVAVGAVILYHAQITMMNLQPFKGGFIGVDIFFVISGYLITSIILKELLTTGSFSFKYFYERRIRRILPALIFVMLVSLPFAWTYLLPSNIMDFSKSILYSLGFSSNFYFHYSGQLYGSESGLLKPFLHTWSLSVEEQFYIIFPLFLFIIFRYFRKFLIFFFIIGFIISLGLAEWLSVNNSSLNFYILPTRGWELLAGSILAYLEMSRGYRSKNKKLNHIFPTLGMILILHSFFVFNEEMLHPSLFTLSPILGVSLIIWFSDKDELISKILSSKLFVGTGLISYSLYLWHFPIFAFARINDFFYGDIINKFIICFVTLIASIISYYFVERFFRDKTNNFFKVSLILAISIFVLLIFNLKSVNNEGFKKRTHFPQVIINTLKTLEYRKNFQNGISCHDRLGDKGFCIFNELPENEGDIILLGDSLTNALLSNLKDQVLKTKYRLIDMSYSGNLYLPNFVRYNKISNKITQIESDHNFRRDFLEKKANKNTYIIFYGDYNYYFEKRLKILDGQIVENETPNIYASRQNINLDFEKRKILLKRKIEESLKNLSKNKKVLLIYPSPISQTNILNHIKNNRKNIGLDENFYKKDDVNYSIDIFRKYNLEILDFFNRLNIKNVKKIDLEKVFCPKDKCIFYDNKNSYIFDKIHPSYEGSKKINDLIMKEIKKIN